MVDSSINSAIALATLLHGQILLRCAARAAHDHAAVLHDVTRIGMAVLVALGPASRIVVAIENGRVALLACSGRLVIGAAEESLEKAHGAVLP